jgi:uncharacterized protein YdeI (YjbR/CyaY-like superfamily)
MKVEKKEAAPVVYTDEMKAMFEKDPALQEAFDALTPGRQRAYLSHFIEPKQEATRMSRIEKCIPRIMNGKGLLDCICGHTKRKPGCDGSHKHFA